MDNYGISEITGKKLAIGLFLVLFIIFSFSYYFHNDMEENFVFTTGKIVEIKGKSRSSSKRLIIEYTVSNKIYKGETSFLSDSLEYYKSNIGKTFLLKMHNRHWVNSVFSTYKLYIDKLVPPYINPPKNGWKTIPIQILVNTINKPLIILNDEEVQFEKLQNINPEKVEKLNVLNSEQSIKKYGEHAQNGALEISLK